MNNNIYLVFAVVLFVVAFFISMSLTVMEFNEEVKTSNRVVGSFPVLGFDNFVADVNWIKLIQIKTPENETENLTLSAQKQKLLNRITSLNPHMDIAYTTKAIDLMFVKDQKVKESALALFERSSLFNSRKTWKTDYYGAFTCLNIALDQKEDQEAKSRFLNRGHHFIKEALQTANCPRFINRYEAHFIKKMGRERYDDLIDMWINLYQSAANDYDKKTCYYNLKAVYQETLILMKELAKSENEDDKKLALKLDKRVKRMKGVLFRDAGHCPNVECPHIAKTDEFYIGRGGQRHCPHCGTSLEYPPTKTICTECMSLMSDSFKHCTDCGSKLPQIKKED